MKKRQIFGFILLVMALIVAGLEKVENQRYEKYLSQKLAHDLSSFSTSVLLSRDSLHAIIKEAEITTHQLTELTFQYMRMEETMEDVISLSSYIDPNAFYPEKRGATPLHILQSFSRFLHQCDAQEVLTEEDLQVFRLMQRVNDSWVEAIDTHIKGIEVPKVSQASSSMVFIQDEYWDLYLHRMVIKWDWIKLIEQLHEGSEQYRKEVEKML